MTERSQSDKKKIHNVLQRKSEKNIFFKTERQREGLRKRKKTGSKTKIRETDK